MDYAKNIPDAKAFESYSSRAQYKQSLALFDAAICEAAPFLRHSVGKMFILAWAMQRMCLCAFSPMGAISSDQCRKVGGLLLVMWIGILVQMQETSERS